MRTIILFLFMMNLLFGGAGSAVLKQLPKFFVKETIVHYGSTGKTVLQILGAKYGKQAVSKFQAIEKTYGKKGISLVGRYGDDAVIGSKEGFSMVSRYGDRGYYMLGKYPKSPMLYANFGDRYMKAVERFGAGRVTRWLTEAKTKENAQKVLRYLEKFGEKAAAFYERNWGKLLISGFALLNAETLVAGGVEVGRRAVHETGEVVKGVSVGIMKEILSSQMIYFFGAALLLYVLFSLWLKWISFKRSTMREQKEFTYPKREGE